MVSKFKYMILFALVVCSVFIISCSKEDNTIEITDPVDPTDPDISKVKVYKIDYQKVLERKNIKEDQVNSIGKLVQLEDKVKLYTPKKITLDDGFLVLEYENGKEKDYALKIENDKVFVNFYSQEFIHFANLNPLKQNLIIEQSFYEWVGFNAKEYVTVNLSGQEYYYSLDQNLQDFTDLQDRRGNFLQVQLVYTFAK